MSLNNIANAYVEAKDFDKVLASIRESIELFSLTGTTKGLGTAYHTLGYILERMEQYDDALRAYDTAISWSRNKGGAIKLARSLNNAGNLLVQIGSVKRAEEYLREAIEIKREINDIYGMATGWANLAGLYAVRNEWDAVNECLRQSYECAIQSGNTEVKRALESVMSNHRSSD